MSVYSNAAKFSGGLMSQGVGLRCRFPGCAIRFLSDGSVEGIRECGAQRNEHELGVHGYAHQVVEVQTNVFANHGGFSSKGRSTLNVRRGFLR